MRFSASLSLEIDIIACRCDGNVFCAFIVSIGSIGNFHNDLRHVRFLSDQVISSDGVTYVDVSHTFSGSS
jgi:hypothetical protein